MAPLHRQILFESPIVRFVDVCCRHSASGCSGEERANAHQLIVVRAGVFVKHPAFASRRSLVAEPMQALLLNADEPYRISHPANDGDDCTVLELPDASARELMVALAPHTRDEIRIPFQVDRAPVMPDMRLALHRLRRVGRGAMDVLKQEEQLLALAERMVRAGYEAHGRSASTRRTDTALLQRVLVERTKELLALAPSARWTLARLAREVGSSPYHLTRVFRAHTGSSIHQYLTGLRLALAMRRLERDGEGHLSTIALETGFSSHSHFSATFRRAFGVAPTILTARAKRSAG